MREMCRRISLALVLRFLKRMKERMMIREPRMEREHDTPTTARMVGSFTSNITSAGGIVDQLVIPGVVGSSSMARLSGLSKFVV
jgi:hypothetical protein